MKQCCGWRWNKWILMDGNWFFLLRSSFETGFLLKSSKKCQVRRNFRFVECLMRRCEMKVRMRIWKPTASVPRNLSATVSSTVSSDFIPTGECMTCVHNAPTVKQAHCCWLIVRLRPFHHELFAIDIAFTLEIRRKLEKSRRSLLFD